jgi:hypothetical protein
MSNEFFTTVVDSWPNYDCLIKKDEQKVAVSHIRQVGICNGKCWKYWANGQGQSRYSVGRNRSVQICYDI